MSANTALHLLLVAVSSRSTGNMLAAIDDLKQHVLKGRLDDLPLVRILGQSENESGKIFQNYEIEQSL